MTTTVKKIVNSNTWFTIITAAFVFAAIPSVSNADGWELRTTLDEVPGTREIESGNFDKAIRISRVRLPHVSQKQKVAVLTNICIGYIMNKDFDEAENYCNQAVERPNEKVVSYNNRGVLKALQGDYNGAMRDFVSAAKSGCFGKCSVSENAPKDLPRPIAKRNFGKAEFQAKAAKYAADDQTAARSN
jgi:hypothetical protein